MKNKKQLTMQIVAVFATIGLLFTALHFYNRHIENTLARFTKKTFYEIAEQQKLNIERELQNRASNIKGVAMTLSKAPVDEEYIYDILNEMAANTSFDILAFVDYDGNLITSDAEKSNIKDDPYFKKTIESDGSSDEAVYYKTDDNKFIYIAAPVINDNVKRGFAIGVLSLENIESLIIPCFNGDGSTFIFNKDGEIISADENEYNLSIGDDILEKLAAATILDGDTVEEMKANILQLKDGMVKYAIEDNARYAVYKPFIINGWTMMMVVPEKAIVLDVDRVMHSTTMLILAITILLIFLFVFFIFTLNKNRKNLQRLAFFDETTNAPNFTKFKIDAAKFVEENKNKNLLLVKLDIQKFKLVNQILGENVGNKVVCGVADALKANTPGKHLRYARLHDDEFLVIYMYHKTEDVKIIMDNFKKQFYKLMGESFEYPINFISGYYYMSSDGCFDLNQASERANIAHREAKKSGVEICVYDKKYVESALIQSQIELKAQNAIDNFEFKVYLQGKYEAKKEVVVGAEALVRWIKNDGIIIMPGDFIPIFEKNHFITKLDFYMFEETCKIIKGWIDANITPVPVSVNFSTLHIFNHQFAKNLCDIVDKYNISHKYLEIEFTETVMASNENRLIILIEQLHKYGFEVSMDDFGTGYSSLGMLKNMNFDTIKLDRSFFMDAHENVKTHSVLSNMINMAIDLGINTVAEGVEKNEHVELMRKLNCDVIQGYYFAKPVPVEVFTKNLIEGTARSLEEIKITNRFNLRKNNELLNEVLYTMPMAFTLWDKNANFVQCNKEAALIVGVENEYALMETLIHTMPEFQPNGERSVDVLTEYITTAYKEGSAKYMSFTLLHIDGREIPCEATFVRLINKGEFLVATYIRDMTSQLEVVKMLKNENLKLKIFMDTMPLCFNLWDEHMNNLMCNKAVVSLFELASEQEYIENFSKLSPEYQPDGELSSDKAEKMINLAFSEGNVTFKWTHQKLNGEQIPTEITLIHTQIDSENFVVGFMSDLR